MSNPFNFGTPVPPQHMVGRWPLVQTVAKDLLNPGGHFHMIVGGRRFGKNSFLEALHHCLIEQMKQSKSEDWYVFPVLVDLHGLEKKTPTGVFGLILNTLYCCFQVQNAQDHYFDIGLEQTKLHFFVKGKSVECTFAHFGKVIVELLEKFVNHYGVLRIAFLIDEIEVALGKDWTESLFNQLRYIASHGWSSKFIRYVIACSPRVIEVREEGSPLLNMLKISYLEALDEASIHTIVGWAGNVSAEVIDTVVQQSGGHPYIAQYLMHYIWESHLSTTTRSSVLGLSNRFIYERHTDLENWLMSIGKQDNSCING